MTGPMNRRTLLGSVGVAAAGWAAISSSSTAHGSEANLSAGVVKAAAVESDVLDLALVIAVPTRFSGIDATGARDSSAGLQAALNATPEGATLVVPPGRYLVGTSLYPRLGKSVTVRAHGAVFVQTSSKPIISITGTYDAVFSVSSLSNGVPTGGSTPATKISTTAATGWAPGDVIKICSDDVIDGSRPGSDGLESRRGEFFVVRSVNGMTVYANGVLRETYGSNIRVARITRQTFHLEGGDFQAAQSRVGQKNSALVLLSQLASPSLRRVSASRASGPAFQFVSCFGYLVTDCEVGRDIDDSGAGIFGYGVLDNSCSFGEVRGGTYRHVRHAFTDDTDRVATNSKIGSYGRTFAATITGVNALMTTNASFDTHHCSEATHFIGCTASGGINLGQGQPGFQLRGRRHRISECVAIGTDTGLQILTETAGGESTEHSISGLAVHDTRGPAVRVQVHGSGHPRAGQRDGIQNAHISGLNARRTNGLISAYNAETTIVNSSYLAPTGSDGQTIPGVYSENSVVRLASTTLDFRENTRGTPRPFSAGSSSGSAPGIQETELQSVTVFVNADVVSRTYGAVNGPDHVLRARGLRFNFPFRYMPGENLHPSSEYDWYVDRGEDNTASRSSAYFVLGNSDWEAQLARVPLSLDLSLFVRLSTTNNWTAAALPAGRRPGQQLTLSHQGTNSWTLPHGTTARTRLRDGTSRRMVAGDFLRLTWDGAAWVEL